MPRVPKKTLPALVEGGETIGQRIARFRKLKGMTQQELADAIGIERILISDYERSRIRLYDELVAHFAKALHVSSDELLGLVKLDTDSEAPSLRLMKRVAEIEKLPEIKKKAILKTLDDLIRANS